MPVHLGRRVRLTRAEDAILRSRAEAHGLGDRVPCRIRDADELDTAHLAAEGNRAAFELVDYLQTGSSAYTRGEMSAEELLGAPVPGDATDPAGDDAT